MSKIYLKVSYDIALIIKSRIENKWFTLQGLNQRICNSTFRTCNSEQGISQIVFHCIWLMLVIKYGNYTFLRKEWSQLGKIT